MANRALALFVLVAALFVGMTKPTPALEFAPLPIDRPLSDALRGPFGNFLREMGVSDVETVLNVTKMVDLSDPLLGPYIAFRIESSPQFCRPGGDMCVTVIAQIIDHGVAPSAMFGAGNTINWADVLSDIAGVRSHQVRFYSRDLIVSVLKTPKGLVVLPVLRDPTAH